MIDSLTLKDFQKHDKIQVDFDQVTTIVGPSDAGKTAILRALCWVIDNRPSGKSLMREGTSDVRARVEVDGHTITRVTTKSQNLYLLDQAELKAFGRNPPTDVTDILKVSPASIQRQMDGVFLLNMSGGDAARYLNEVSGISVLDRSVKQIASDVKTLTSEASGLDDDRRECQEAGRACERLADDLTLLEGLKVQAEELEALEAEIAALESVVADSNIQVREVPDLLPLIEEITELSNQIGTLEMIFPTIAMAQRDVDKHAARVLELEEELEKIETCPTCQRPL